MKAGSLKNTRSAKQEARSGPASRPKLVTVRQDALNEILGKLERIERLLNDGLAAAPRRPGPSLFELRNRAANTNDKAAWKAFNDAVEAETKKGRDFRDIMREANTGPED